MSSIKKLLGCISVLLFFQLVPNSIGAPLSGDITDLLLRWMNFGDYMEIDIGVSTACDAHGDETIKMEVFKKFASCLSRIDKRPAHYDGKIVSVCKNPKKYLQCWAAMNADVVNECGSVNESLLPDVYRATFASHCGTDKGASNIRRFHQAVDEMDPGDLERCSDTENTFENYRDHCESLLPKMQSSDICTRHAAISACMNSLFLFICDNHIPNIFMAYLHFYEDARPHLECS